LHLSIPEKILELIHRKLLFLDFFSLDIRKTTSISQNGRKKNIQSYYVYWVLVTNLTEKLSLPKWRKTKGENTLINMKRDKLRELRSG
jgi:hypothetical protein